MTKNEADNLEIAGVEGLGGKSKKERRRERIARAQAEVNEVGMNEVVPEGWSRQGFLKRLCELTPSASVDEQGDVGAVHEEVPVPVSWSAQRRQKKSGLSLCAAFQQGPQGCDCPGPCLAPVQNGGASSSSSGGGVAAEHDDEDAEQARPANQGRTPYSPTAAERAAHEATHLPFRSWCRHCVEGRRDSPGHVAVDVGEQGVAEVGLDYAFIRKEGESQTQTILVLKDRLSRALRAWVLRAKGACLDESVECAVEGIKQLGHVKVLLRTDNEPALGSPSRGGTRET